MPRPHRLAGSAFAPLVAGSLAASALVAAAPAAAAEGSDLIISEVVEGSSNNKAIELYNPTGGSIDLTAGGYAIRMYFNGAVTPGLTVTLSGAVPAGGTWVLAQATASATILAQADQTNGASWYNGDDALVLTKSAGTSVVDSIGHVGVDPGTEWGTGLTSTADNTVRRAPGVCVGDAVTNDAFDPATEWVGFATDAFDGLGAHTSDCGGVVEPATPVINEFSASTTGTDVEYVEVLGEPGADLSGYSVLSVEGDVGSTTAPLGVVDAIIPLGTADADGRYLASLEPNTLENGTMSLLLAEGYAGAVGDDLDTTDDGILDDGPERARAVDSVAVHDGDAGDAAYGDTVLAGGYDGEPVAPGGASRIPDGVDTDAPADWVRNDFDLAGIPGFQGTLVDGEAVNTPGAENTTTPVTDPGGDTGCDAPVVTIGSVQGSGAASPAAGATVEIEGVVTGDFQVGGFDGYYVQDAGDGDPATSDGIFVYAQGGAEVAVGDAVHVKGAVSEYFELTEITPTAVEVCATGAESPAPVELTLPIDPAAREPLEGMRVAFREPLTIIEYFEHAQYGQIVLGKGRQYQPTATFEPGSPQAVALAEKNAAERITLDDGRSQQNPDPASHPNGQPFTLDNRFRGGDLVSNVIGVLDYRFAEWAIQPTQAADHVAANPRTDVPEVAGGTTVASFNVLNYFTTLGSRGADTQAEFERQQAKIVSAIAEIDADIVGLIEIENDGDAVEDLVDALNAKLGTEAYAAVPTGVLGTDEITTAFIYQPARVQPVGEFAVLDETIDARFDTTRNRPALAQTFADIETGGDVTVAVNHLKSKGSACADDPDAGDGQGNCSDVRTRAAEALAAWLATGPTGAEPGRDLIIGDLNAYDKEDPIRALVTAGFTDLRAQFEGEDAYSYVFDGQLGYLDHALAAPGLVGDVVGTAGWTINADESSLIDYDMTHKRAAQDALFAADPYRSSDHDPVIIGLDLVPPPDTTAPELVVTADPAVIARANNKFVPVHLDVQASDDSGAVAVELVEATSSGSRADLRVISWTEVEVRAVKRAVYTLRYEATDPSGNVTTYEVAIRVAP